MGFKKAKCKLLHLDWGNHRYVYRFLESNLAEKNLGILVNEKLDKNQQCALVAQKANSILVCIIRKLAPLFPSFEAPFGVLLPGLRPSVQEGYLAVGGGTEEGHKEDQRAGAPLL